MPIPRYGKRDLREREVMDALRAIDGVSVVQLSQDGIPDLLVGFDGITCLMDVKSRGVEWTRSQTRFIQSWNGSRIWRVETPEEATDIVLSLRRT